MGEAKRKRQAGYVPEPKQVRPQPKLRMAPIGYGGVGRMAMIAALLADYPKLPNDR